MPDVKTHSGRAFQAYTVCQTRGEVDRHEERMLRVRIGGPSRAEFNSNGLADAPRRCCAESLDELSVTVVDHPTRNLLLGSKRSKCRH